MKKVLLLSTLLITNTLFSMSATPSKVTRVAYINIAKILPSSEYGEAVNLDEGCKEWRERTKSHHEELQKRVQAMRAKAERLAKLSEELESKKKGQWLSDSTREQKTEEAMKLQSELEIEQQALNRFVTPIQRAQAEMSPKLQQAVYKIAEEQGWDIVLFGGALYASKDADITKDVITELNALYDADRKKPQPVTK